MSGIRGLPDDVACVAQRSPVGKMFSGWELGTNDVLYSFHHPLQGFFFFRHRAFAKTQCDRVGQDVITSKSLKMYVH